MGREVIGFPIFFSENDAPCTNERPFHKGRGPKPPPAEARLSESSAVFAPPLLEAAVQVNKKFRIFVPDILKAHRLFFFVRNLDTFDNRRI